MIRNVPSSRNFKASTVVRHKLSPKNTVTCAIIAGSKILCPNNMHTARTLKMAFYPSGINAR